MSAGDEHDFVAAAGTACEASVEWTDGANG